MLFFSVSVLIKSPVDSKTVLVFSIIHRGLEILIISTDTQNRGLLFGNESTHFCPENLISSCQTNIVIPSKHTFAKHMEEEGGNTSHYGSIAQSCFLKHDTVKTATGNDFFFFCLLFACSDALRQMYSLPTPHFTIQPPCNLVLPEQVGRDCSPMNVESLCGIT